MISANKCDVSVECIRVLFIHELLERSNSDDIYVRHDPRVEMHIIFVVRVVDVLSLCTMLLFSKMWKFKNVDALKCICQWDALVLVNVVIDEYNV